MTRRGFTLIELLVVIAIIAILAAILFPAFVAAKEQGRQTACLSNLKQLGHAFTMYVNDWRAYPGGGPCHRPNTSGTNPGGEWVVCRSSTYASNTMDVQHGGIFKYTKSAKVFVCPSDFHARKVLDGRYPFGLSYSMNFFMDRDLNNGRPVTDSMVVRPAKTVLLIDEGAGTTVMVDGHFGPGIDDPGKIHNAGTNFAFCDGHAKWYKYEYYCLPFDPKAPNANKLNFYPGFEG